MVYRIIYLPKADQNLLSIDEYLEQFYPSTASKFFTELDRKVLLLQEMPYIGEQYPHNSTYRRLVVGDFLVFYIVDEDKQVIQVHRVLHGSRDIERHL